MSTSPVAEALHAALQAAAGSNEELERRAMPIAAAIASMTPSGLAEELISALTDEAQRVCSKYNAPVGTVIIPMLCMATAAITRGTPGLEPLAVAVCHRLLKGAP